MKIICLSDLHGSLPVIPDGDLVIIAGDLCPHGDLRTQIKWIHGKFRPWLEELPPTVYVAGNHDFIYERERSLTKLFVEHAHYLEDEYVAIKDLVILGTPWSLNYGRWAFMCSEAAMERRLARFTKRPDILISHGPPKGVGDYVPQDAYRAGSRSLLDYILTYEPRLVVTGHIHESYGVYECGRSTVINAAYGRLKNAPLIFEF